MRFLSGCFLAGNFHGQTAEFFQGALELVVDLLALRLLHTFQFRRRSLQSLIGAASKSGDHLQLPWHLLDGSVRGLDLGLALGFHKQLRLFENALPDLGRCLAPGGV